MRASSQERVNDLVAASNRVTKEFIVGRHKVGVSQVVEGRWTFTVNDGEVSNTFPTAADAWAAGVHAAYRLDA